MFVIALTHDLNMMIFDTVGVIRSTLFLRLYGVFDNYLKSPKSLASYNVDRYLENVVLGEDKDENIC